MIFYFGAVVYVFFMYLDRRVYIWESIICLVIYVCYVAVVVLGRCINQRLKKRRARIAELKAKNTDLGENLLEGDDKGKEEDQELKPQRKKSVRFAEQVQVATVDNIDKPITEDVKQVTESGKDEEDDDDQDWTGTLQILLNIRWLEKDTTFPSWYW